MINDTIDCGVAWQHHIAAQVPDLCAKCTLCNFHGSYELASDCRNGGLIGLPEVSVYAGGEGLFA